MCDDTITITPTSLDDLYGDQEEITAISKAVKAIAPWANDPKHPVTNHEIGLVVRRCQALALDPLNSSEVHIWKDKKGIHMQLAYQLLTQWIRHIHGGHTAPTYHDLDDEELIAEGLPETSIAIRCTFILNSDMDRMLALTDAGFDPAEARAMFTRTGLGTAHIQEWNDFYFAPAGRSKAWKLRKRALSDAYRMLFGTPSRSDILELRRLDTPTLHHRDTALPFTPARQRQRLFKTEE